jgi:16S rRNA processing protein RimM
VRVVIGKVGRPHGIDGAFFVEQPSEDKRWWKTGATFFAGGAPVEVVGHRTSSGRPVIKVDKHVERGSLLEVERDALPKTAEDEYYAFELVGLAVEEEGGRFLGRVADVVDYPANDVLELDSGAFLPLVEACVRKVDVEGGRIVVAAGFAEAE